MTDVFISYKKEDVARVEPIARALANAGYEVWWDHRIPPGRTYRDVIGATLQSAKCVVVVWSNLSTKAQWVLDEADEGKKRNVLLPLIIDNVDIPYGFRQIEAARLIGWRGDVNDPEWVDALAAVAHLVGRRPGGPAKPFARPTIAPQAHPDNAAHARAPRGGGMSAILGALLIAALAGGGYFAWRSGASGPPAATQSAPQTTAATPPIATATTAAPPTTTTHTASAQPTSSSPVTQTPTPQTQTAPQPPASDGKPAQSNDSSPASLATGDFNSSFGAMHLDSNGGTYAYSNGRIRILNASATAIAGTWEQDRSSQRCADGRYWGRFRMQFTAAGFTGTYAYCDAAAAAGPWNGTRNGAQSNAASSCASGYVWREASADDHVCVTPDSRLQARRENHDAPQYVNPNGIYGANTCVSGYVWREAYSGDVVCVTSARRNQIRQENAQAASHAN